MPISSRDRFAKSCNKFPDRLQIASNYSLFGFNMSPALPESLFPSLWRYFYCVHAVDSQEFEICIFNYERGSHLMNHLRFIINSTVKPAGSAINSRWLMALFWRRWTWTKTRELPLPDWGAFPVSLTWFLILIQMTINKKKQKSVNWTWGHWFIIHLRTNFIALLGNPRSLHD